MNQVIFLFFLAICSFPTLAQTSEVIRSSRPGQSFTPYSVGKNVFQIQSGINFNGFNETNSSTDGNGIFFAALARFGITETIEVRSEFLISRDELQTGNEKEVLKGLSAWNIGIRFNILNPDEATKPALGFQADLSINAVSSDFKSDHIAPKLLLLHSQALNPWLGLTTNWGVAWSGFDATPRGFYTFALTFALGDKWALLAENYGEVESGDFDSWFDAGLAYLVNNDLQLDFGMGYGENDATSDYFVDAGVSIRF
jgi:hypothetical protein